MLKKIISGGQTGADQAALDAAINCGFPHGGWIQKGRRTKEGLLPDKYELAEMSVAGYKDRIEKNVMNSDGTVIFSHGSLTGGADYSMRMAEKHKLPGLHMDLNKTPAAAAPSKINTWTIENLIEILNVTGSRVSEDPAIYRNTRYVVKNVILLSLIKARPHERLADYDRKQLLDKLPISPGTVDEAVDQVISDLNLKDRLKITNTDLDDLLDSDEKVPGCLKKFYKRWSGNTELLVSCRAISRKTVFRDDHVRRVIIKTLWNKLRESNGLRLVK